MIDQVSAYRDSTLPSKRLSIVCEREANGSRISGAVAAKNCFAFGRHNVPTTLFSRQHQTYEYHALEPLTSADIRKKKEHTALFMTLGGIAIATGLYALLGKMHAKGTLSEIKDPDNLVEHTKAFMHKIGKSAHSMGTTIKGWFKK